MPNFRVRVCGVSLCYFDAERFEWNVIFPCDGEHRVRFHLNANPSKDIREEGRALKIEFPVPDPHPERSEYQDSIRMFNMSAYYAHETTSDESSRLKSNLKKHDLRAAEGDFVWLVIPNSTRRAIQYSDQVYYVQDVTKNRGLPIELIDKVAREVTFEFTLNDPLDLHATDQRNPAHPTHVEGPIPVPPDGSIQVLCFNNDCGDDCPEENDFLHLYRFLEDRNSDPKKKKRKFAAGQIKTRVILDDGTTKSTTYGNCDPVESNPPPWGP